MSSSDRLGGVVRKVPRMVKTGEHSVRDWLQVHGLDLDFAREAVRTARRNTASPFSNFPIECQKAVTPETANAHHYFRFLIAPALSNLVGDNELVNLLNSVQTTIVSEENLDDGPYVSHVGRHGGPEILISWVADARHINLYAHEVAHAAQIIMSNQRWMPPMAREVCAFLGELAVLDYALTTDHGLFQALYRDWNGRMKHDLDVGANLLLKRLDELGDPYEYSMNYPLARYLAARVYSRYGPQWIRGFFRSGEAAMDYLNMPKLLEIMEGKDNYLPVFEDGGHCPDAIVKYKLIGALALLDIEDWRMAARAPIGDYFRENIEKIESGDVCIQFDSKKRPSGYVRQDGVCFRVFSPVAVK